MTAPPSTAPLVTLRSPSDVVGSVPWLVGFQPAESLVLLCLRGQSRQLGLTMRVDLPSPPAQRAFVDDVVRWARRGGAATVLLVCYCDEPDDLSGLPRAALLRRLRSRFGRHGIACPESVLVRRGRWWSYGCRAACCPPEGTPLPAVPTGAVARVASEAAFRGRSVLAGREELARSVAGPSGARLDALAELHDRVALCAVADMRADLRAARVRTLALAGSALAAYAETGAPPRDADSARIAVGLFDKAARDEVGTWVLDKPPEALLGLLGEIARRAPDEVCVPVCTALAWVAHSCGDGALANVALDRALAVEPDYSMARLIRQALDAEVRPEVLETVNRAIRRKLATGDAAAPAPDPRSAPP